MTPRNERKAKHMIFHGCLKKTLNMAIAIVPLMWKRNKLLVREGELLSPGTEFFNCICPVEYIYIFVA